ncbi:HotDog domain-containing protein, partial [Pelagophyceae sp. CCMP2097]
LDLNEIDARLFLAPHEHLFVPPGGRGIFGGQIVGQALHAATRTVDGTFPSDGRERTWAAHSLHSYFLQAGDPQVDVVYHVRKTSDRRSFVTRTVEARQRGETIFTCQVSFTKVLDPSVSLEHAEPGMPDVPPPE